MAMRRTLQALIMALLITLIIGAEPARAAECVLLEYQLPRLDTVVDGRITEISADGRIRLEVVTYYKGTGGPSLEAVVFGLGNPGGRMDWSRTPRRGDRVLIGFVREDETLRNNICHLMMILRPKEEIPAEVRSLLGAETPTGVVPDDHAGPWVWVLIGGLAAAAASLTATWYLRRRRN